MTTETHFGTYTQAELDAAVAAARGEASGHDESFYFAGAIVMTLAGSSVAFLLGLVIGGWLL